MHEKKEEDLNAFKKLIVKKDAIFYKLGCPVIQKSNAINDVLNVS